MCLQHLLSPLSVLACSSLLVVTRLVDVRAAEQKRFTAQILQRHICTDIALQVSCSALCNVVHVWTAWLCNYSLYRCQPQVRMSITSTNIAHHSLLVMPAACQYDIAVDCVIAQ